MQVLTKLKKWAIAHTVQTKLICHGPKEMFNFLQQDEESVKMLQKAEVIYGGWRESVAGPPVFICVCVGKSVHILQVDNLGRKLTYETRL